MERNTPDKGAFPMTRNYKPTVPVSFAFSPSRALWPAYDARPEEP